MRCLMSVITIILLSSCSSVENKQERKDIVLQLADELDLINLSITCKAGELFLLAKLEDHGKVSLVSEKLIKDSSQYLAKCKLISGIACFRNAEYAKAKGVLFQSMDLNKDDFRAYIYIAQVMKAINDDNSKEFIRGMMAIADGKGAEITDGERLAYKIILSDSPPADFLNKLGAIKNDIYSAAFVLAEYARLKNDDQTYKSAKLIADKKRDGGQAGSGQAGSALKRKNSAASGGRVGSDREK